ncbi:flippase [Candidatus Methanoperedens nitratireducens]|uniref:Putative Polysaccharide biosynthesis protein n=1 Tax=Candidatus Methanoperedens nitratireducens TaxID=1392998 RepID=A0A284VNS8_9EURY|nr:flippase [Candidatus Methanoperedens nitroreducens]SNQ60924.1 putative Polysaccharide biosynthesis protein [Candidatus Methanoperedens nitroreducens]
MNIKIIKNISALALGELVTRTLGLVLVIYLARYLGETGFGRYSFAFAFTSLFLVVTDLGMNTVIIRDIAREKTLVGRYIGNVLVLRGLLSLISFSLIAVVINLMGYPAETRMAVYIVGIYTIITSFSQLTRSVFRAFEKMEYEALLNIMERLIFVSLGILVLVLGYGLIEVVSVFLIAGAVNVLLSFHLTKRKFAVAKLEADRELWKYLIGEGLPFGIAFIFINVYIKVDTVILSSLKGDAVVGWYNAAYQIPLAISLISYAMMESIFPMFSRLGNSREELTLAYEKTFRFLSMLIIPVVAGITLLSDKIIFILYGRGYENSITILQILIWLTVFEFLGYLLYITLSSINKQRVNILTTGTCAVLNITLNLILIPPFSLIGAGIAKIITYIVFFFLNFYFVSKYVCRVSIYRAINRPVIASLAMGVVLFFMNDLNIFVLVPLAGSFYMTVLYLVKGFSKEDLKLIYNL